MRAIKARRAASAYDACRIDDFAPRRFEAVIFHPLYFTFATTTYGFHHADAAAVLMPRAPASFHATPFRTFAATRRMRRV